MIQSRVSGVRLPPSIFPVTVVADDGGYALYPPGSAASEPVCKYPAERVFMKKYADLLREMSERESIDTPHALSYLIDRMLEKGLAETAYIGIDELAVHPYNVRYMPVEDIPVDIFAHLRLLVEQRDLLVPIIATPVDQRIVSILDVIRRGAVEGGLEAAPILRGICWRAVEVVDDGLAAGDGDPIFSATGRRRIKYLVVDGYLRYAATCLAYLDDRASWRSIPRMKAVVLKMAENVGIDVLSAAYISRTANLFERDILGADVQAFANFANLFKLSEAFTRLGAVLNLEGLVVTGKATLAAPTFIGGDEEKVEYAVGDAPPVQVEEELEPGFVIRRRSDRGVVEEAATAPRLEQPHPYQAAVEQPILRAGPASEEAPAQAPTAQPLAEPTVSQLVSELTRVYVPALMSGGPWGGVDLRLDFNSRRFLNTVDERPQGSVRYIPFNDLPLRVGGASLKVSAVLPLYILRHGPALCPSCRTPIVLSPVRCLSCGEVISDPDLLPLPYTLKTKRQ